MFFIKGQIFAFLCISIPLFFPEIAQLYGQNDFVPRITSQRTVNCPLELDTRGLKSKKERKAYFWEQAMAELPYENMKNAVGLHTDIDKNQILESRGGHFIINDDKSSVSQLVCEYADDNGQSAHLTLSFRTDVTFHVAGHLPSTPGETIFPQTKDCAAIDELDRAEKPHCRATLASLLVTNQIEVIPVQGYPENLEMYGHLNYKSMFEFAELPGEPWSFDQESQKKLIRPGETRFYPVSFAPSHHGVSVDVRVLGDSLDVSKLCINQWLPRANMLVKYGASPHILISGQVGTDGNLKTELKCELRCNEKEDQKDCWNLWSYEMLTYFLTRGPRPDLRREYLISELHKAYGSDIDFSRENENVLVQKYQAIPYYKELDLEPGVSNEKVVKVFRQLSKKYNPDQCGTKMCKKQLDQLQSTMNRLKVLIRIPDRELEEEDSMRGWRYTDHDRL